MFLVICQVCPPFGHYLGLGSIFPLTMTLLAQCMSVVWVCCLHQWQGGLICFAHLALCLHTLLPSQLCKSVINGNMASFVTLSQHREVCFPGFNSLFYSFIYFFSSHFILIKFTVETYRLALLDIIKRTPITSLLNKSSLTTGGEQPLTWQKIAVLFYFFLLVSV